MRILFVKPNMGLVQGKPYDDRGRMEPLTFGVLKAATPEGHDVVLCDDRFEPVPYDEHWDVVGINTEVYTARRAYEIADRFRSLGVTVIVGGYHTTMIPEESLEHSDAIAIGEAEAAWPRILADSASGSLRRVYRGSDFPLPGTRLAEVDRTLYSGKRYLPVALTQFGRGCRNCCEYCATGNIFQGSLFTRPARDVAAELERVATGVIFFADDNIVADIPAAKELMRRLIPLKLRWIGQASLNCTSDPELMHLMARSGCSGLVIGFESLDPDNLHMMNKSVNTGHGTYDDVVTRLRDAGILIWAAFLLGYDNETAQSIRETVDWALSKKFAFSAFNILMPYPGTAFYRRMQQEGRLMYGGKWWLHDDYRFGQTGFRPKHLSPEELSEEGLRARLKHNSIFQVLRRATEPHTNCRDLWSLATYFAYNPLFRDELLRKHGMMLGYRGYER